MALFGKKKLSLKEILDGINALTEEEKAQALASLQGNNAETETEVEDTEVETTESEEVTEETQEQPTETEAVEDTEAPEQAPMEAQAQPAPTEESADEVLPEAESATDEMAQDNRDEIIHQLTDKVNELSEQMKSLLELKSLMEEYTGKQAENFGYKGNVLGAKKDFKDMSTEELKQYATKGI